MPRRQFGDGFAAYLTNGRSNAAAMAITTALRSRTPLILTIADSEFSGVRIAVTSLFKRKPPATRHATQSGFGALMAHEAQLLSSGN
jgi:hypothetical protein